MLPGQRIADRYEIVRRIGKGGMGAVYEAKHLGTGGRVALKVILTGDFGEDSEITQRFEREARAAGSINSQHIVRVFDTGADPETGMPFMVMDLLHGQDLHQLVKRVGPLPQDLALRLVGQAALGLSKAHEAGVIHRDIKPANLYLADGDGEDCTLKILDFGIAKVKMDNLHATNEQGLTRTGSMLGSPHYMSPEQAMGSKKIDHRADVWALGAVLYKLLTGRTPHEQVTMIGPLIFAITRKPAPALQRFAPWVRPEIAAIAHRALQIDPAGRYGSVTEMLEVIRPLAPNGFSLQKRELVGISEVERARAAPRLPLGPEHDEPDATPDDPFAPPSFSTGSGTTKPASAATNPVAPPRKRAPILVGSIAILALIGFGAVKILDRGKTPANPAPEPRTNVEAAPVAAIAAPRTVQVEVTPRDAEVEVDGQPTQVAEGVFSISGALGSVHKVRARHPEHAELDEDVVIAEQGAVPAAITLKKAPGKQAKTKVDPIPGATPARTRPPVKNTGKLGIETSFD